MTNGSTPPATSGGPIPPWIPLLQPLLIAAIVAALHYAGWSYRQAFLLRSSIDPSSVNGSTIALGVEGLAAIALAAFEWLIASAWLLLAIVVVVAVCVYWDRRRGRPIVIDPSSRAVIRWMTIFAGLGIVAISGTLAGRRAADDRVRNVQRGETWSYHLPKETIEGVLLAQTSELDWVLTCAGVRPLRTADIQQIDGPLFQRVTGVDRSARGRGCAAQGRTVAEAR